MTTEAPLVDVEFRVFPDGEVIALFPGLPGTPDPLTCSSYMHVGQHGAADYQGMLDETQPATRREFAALREELASAPYNYNLRVVGS